MGPFWMLWTCVFHLPHSEAKCSWPAKLDEKISSISNVVTFRKSYDKWKEHFRYPWFYFQWHFIRTSCTTCWFVNFRQANQGVQAAVTICKHRICSGRNSDSFRHWCHWQTSAILEPVCLPLRSPMLCLHCMWLASNSLFVKHCVNHPKVTGSKSHGQVKVVAKETEIPATKTIESHLQKESSNQTGKKQSTLIHLICLCKNVKVHSQE